jgi:hypothetical protein
MIDARARVVWVAAVVAASLVGVAQDRPSPPAATPAIGGFAFPNAAGDRLMLFTGVYSGRRHELSEPAIAARAFHTAFCGADDPLPVDPLPVAFERVQAADGKGNGRQSHWQFDHLEGLVYAFKNDATITVDRNCFLAADAFMRSLVVVPLTSVKPAWSLPADIVSTCDAARTKDIASRRGRAVTGCWPLATARARGGPTVLVVEFARQKDDALASVVVVDGGRMVFNDHHGSYANYAGTSVWRADDEGRIEPHGFEVLLLARRGNALVLAFSWAAPEGTALMLLESDSDRFRELLRDAWYQAPV